MAKSLKIIAWPKTTISTICSWWEWLLVITAILFHCFPFTISYFGIFYKEDYKLIFMPKECTWYLNFVFQKLHIVNKTKKYAYLKLRI